MIRTALPFLCMPLPAFADINVVADIAPIHSLTAQIMGETGTPTLILPVNADAHDFAFRPSDAQALQDADLVIMVGPSLTPWLADPVEALAGDATHLVLSETEGWTTLEMRSEHDHGHGDHDDHDGHDDHSDEAHDDHGDEDHDDHDDHDHEDHAEDGHDEHDHEEHADKDHDDHEHDAHDDHDDEAHDDHDGETAAVDPHAWSDPTIASVWAGHIAQALSDADPENAAIYAANLATMQANLAALDEKYTTQLADVGPLLWPHDGYQYFEVRYSLNAKGSIADLNAMTPGPGRIQALIDLVAAENVSCIMTDREINGDWAELVSNGSDAGTTYIDVLGSAQTPGPNLYEGMMDTLVTAIADC